MSTRRRRAALLAAVAVVVLVLPVSAQARLVRFQTPSHKIACGYETTERQLRCDALFLNDVGFFLERQGNAKRRRVTDTVAARGAKVLAYGRTIEFGSLTCASRRTGLKCKSRVSGHGFRLSRREQKLF